jgi:hypothetical protein
VNVTIARGDTSQFASLCVDLVELFQGSPVTAKSLRRAWRSPDLLRRLVDATHLEQYDEGDPVRNASSGDNGRQQFLQGPVPLLWLEAAARLPGKSLHTGVALWYAAGLTQCASVPLSNVSGHQFGLDRNAKYRALDWLEKAGLVQVNRKLGRSPVVTILSRTAPP